LRIETGHLPRYWDKVTKVGFQAIDIERTRAYASEDAQEFFTGNGRAKIPAADI
jgi:hypothetical protein